MSPAPSLPTNRRKVVALAAILGVTQTVGYGTLYYAFGVLAPLMSKDTGLSLAGVFGLFSLALAASGLIAPRAGRIMDRQSPAMVMTLGSALCAASLALWAVLPGQASFAIFTVIVELCSILVLYEAAFVTAARLVPLGDARSTITGITFVAGFASTVFWPLTQWLATFLTWREVYLVYAIMQIAICLPLHALVWRSFPLEAEVARPAGTPAAANGAIADPAARRRVFALLIVGFSAQSFVIAAVHLHLIGLLGGLGMAASAAFVGAMLGPSQVAARMIEFAGSTRFSATPALVFCAVSLPVALLILLAGAPALAAALVFALMFGAGQGLSYVVRGTLPLQVFGRDGYGEITGWFNSARLYVAAFAPFATAVLFENAGVAVAVGCLAAMAAIAGVALVMVARSVSARPA